MAHKKLSSTDYNILEKLFKENSLRDIFLSIEYLLTARLKVEKDNDKIGLYKKIIVRLKLINIKLP